MGEALETHNHINYTYTGLYNDRSNQSLSEDMSSHNTFYSESKISFIIRISTLVICFWGLVGNGIVIWLLGFRIKRNPFSIYILNMAVADFGILVSASMMVARVWFIIFHYLYIPLLVVFLPFLLMCSASQFLLTAISVDRCVAIFFPLWHRCRRPPRLSTIVCALIWFLSFLLTMITGILVFLNFNELSNEDGYQFFVNALLCLPVLTMATVSLFIKICLKERQCRRGKLLTIILLTLLFFLLFAFPLDVICILYIFDPFLLNIRHIFPSAVLLACLNSSINPTIYILVGREWKSRHKQTLNMIFQKVFKGEEGCAEETPVESQS